MSPTDLLLVDDDVGFRSTARALLTSAGFGVLAEAATGVEALAAAAALGPTLVLLDVQLPDVDGFEVARQLRAGPEPPDVVLISTREAIDYGRRIHDCGALGFITKSSLSAASLRAILQTDGNE